MDGHRETTGHADSAGKISTICKETFFPEEPMIDFEDVSKLVSFLHDKKCCGSLYFRLHKKEKNILI